MSDSEFEGARDKLFKEGRLSEGDLHIATVWSNWARAYCMNGMVQNSLPSDSIAVEKSSADKLANAIEKFWISGASMNKHYYEDMIKELKEYRGLD